MYQFIKLNVPTGIYSPGNVLKHYKITTSNEFIGNVLLVVNVTNKSDTEWMWYDFYYNDYITRCISKDIKEKICNSYDYYRKYKVIVIIAKINLIKEILIDDVINAIKNITISKYLL